VRSPSADVPHVAVFSGVRVCSWWSVGTTHDGADRRGVSDDEEGVVGDALSNDHRVRCPPVFLPLRFAMDVSNPRPPTTAT
jgi:hypothetical protein